MRILIAGALALLLAACNPQSGRTSSAQTQEACARTSTHDVTWSRADAPDTVSARADGPSCAQSVVTLTIRNADGDPLWTFASTHYDMTVGGAGFDAPAVSAEEVDSFLASWVDVTINRSGELPAWAEDAEDLSEAVDGMSYHTDLDRDTYEMLRARDLPQLCFAAAAEASQCLVIDPLSNAPIVTVAFGP